MCFSNVAGAFGRNFICECVRERDGNFTCRCVRRNDDDNRRRFICREISETGADGIVRRRFLCTEISGGGVYQYEIGDNL